MAVTVSGTSITFNDGSVQTSAGGAVNTTTVLNATAGASLGQVGSYAFLSRPVEVSSPITQGTTYAGSGLRYAGGSAFGTNVSISSTAPSGTWRALGYGNSSYICGAVYQYATLFLRIS